MKNHRGLVFSNAAHVDSEVAASLLLHVQRWVGEVALPGIVSFTRTVKCTLASAPGPDRAGRHTYWSTHPAHAQCLYDCLVAVWNGEVPPSWLNEATVIFIPKATADSTDTFCRAPPSRYRPLTLANASQKFIAKAIDSILE